MYTEYSGEKEVLPAVLTSKKRKGGSYHTRASAALLRCLWKAV